MYLFKRKKKIYLLFPIILLIFFYFLSFRFYEIKKDFGQEIRIFLKTPTLYHADQSIISNFKNWFFLLQEVPNTKKKFEQLKFDIKLKDFEIIKKDREEALKVDSLINPHKVNAKIQWNNKTYDAKIRLKGWLSEHWLYSKQWSFRIELKENQALFGMNEFSISKHTARQYPYYDIISKMQKRLGITTPNYKTIRVNVNGIDWGVMLIEEQFSTASFEKRSLVEAPVFRITNDAFVLVPHPHRKWQGVLRPDIDGGKKTLLKTKIPNQYTNLNLISLIRSVQETILLEDDKKIVKSNLAEFINIKLFARLIATYLVWMNEHSIAQNSVKFYINPHTLKIEPIPYDYGYPMYFFNSYKVKSETELLKNFQKLTRFKFINWLVNLEDFHDEYLLALNEIETDFNKIKDDLNDSCDLFSPSCYTLVDLTKVKLHLMYLKKFGIKVFSKRKKDQYIGAMNFISQFEIPITQEDRENFKKIINNNIFNEIIYFRLFEDGEIVFFNLTPAKIFIKKIVLFKDLINGTCHTSECKEINFKNNLEIPPSTYDQINTKKVFLDNKIKEFKSAKIDFSYDNEIDSEFIIDYIEDINFKKDNFFIDKNITIPENFLLKGNNYIINSGEYEITKPLIIPNNYNLIINSGVNIKFSNNSYIYVNKGFIKINGTAKNPVILEPLNDYWGGIFVESAPSTSLINNTKILGVNYFKHGAIQLTGGINFYKSDIVIDNCIFKNSLAEDNLNLVKSNFKILNSTFHNSTSDAVDSDFSEGEIINNSYENIAGDAIDTSVSKVKISYTNFKNISDKGISAGENSKIILNNIKIEDATISIASKDDSFVKGENITIFNSSLYDLAAYNKKFHFNGGQIYLENTISDNKFLVQKYSYTKVNGKEIKSREFNTKILY